MLHTAAQAVFSRTRTSSVVGSVSPPTVYFQPEIDSPAFANVIGQESIDPPFSSCGTRKLCRNADVLFAPWNSVATTAPSRGTIARTTFVGTPAGSDVAVGSVRIDPVAPRFYVTAELTTLTLGQAVDKMGQNTGWTSGNILNTCYEGSVRQTFHPPIDTSWVIPCAVMATYGHNFGDSGSLL